MDDYTFDEEFSGSNFNATSGSGSGAISGSNTSQPKIQNTNFT